MAISRQRALRPSEVLVVCAGILVASPLLRPLLQSKVTSASECGSADRRTAWRYSQKELTVTLIAGEGSRWIAERSDGGRPVYDETGRTDDYVELKNRQTKLLVRLHADRAYWRRPNDADWTPWVRGGWVDAPEDAPRDAPQAVPVDAPSPASPSGHTVRLAYFVPRDRKPAAEYERKIRTVMAIVRELYRDDLRAKGYKTEGLRFDGGNDRPVVQLVRGDRAASHYNNAPAYDADEQWRRLLPEVREKVGDPRRTAIVVFVETYDDGPAEHLWPGVIARGAYNTADGGLAVFSSHLLRDEFCAATVEDQRRLFFDQTPVRGRRAWGHRMDSPRGEIVEDGIGAVAHELGHALGLPHDRRDDVHYIMGNGFRNLRWNFAVAAGRRVRFSDDDARLLMSSRYVADDLDPNDRHPPQVEVSRPRREDGSWSVTVKTSDDTGLRAVVFVDRDAGSILVGQKLAGKSHEFRQRLSPSNAKAHDLKLQVIVTDNGGHQARTTVDSSVSE